MKLRKDQVADIGSVKFNPLANYKLQTSDNYITKEKTIGETSLGDDIRLPLVGLDDDDVISYKEDMAVLEYCKIISIAKNRDKILAMKPSSQSLFIWIVFALQYRSDTVTIQPDKINSLGLKIAPASLKEAIEELEENKIIKRIGSKRTADYWNFHINPQYIFKGDAKQFYKDVLHYHPDYASKEVV